MTYVEVTIGEIVPTYFLSVLGYKSMNVAAQAISGAVAGPACIYALDPFRLLHLFIDWQFQ